jgi:hypothetical protein
MKRLLIIVFALVVAVFATGFFLPKEKLFTKTVNAVLPFDGISRAIVNKDQWKNWWPGTVINDSILSYQETSFTIHLLLLNGFQASVKEGDRTVNIDFQSAATYNAETALTLTARFSFSSNPLMKIFQHLSAVSSQKKYEDILDTFKTNFSDIQKIYGFDIQTGKVPNSSYISTKQDFDHYPSNEEIYKMIDDIKTYIAAENSKVMNDPILHIVKESDKLYSAMVAVASDKDLPGKGKFMLKQMMLGNIIVARVTGGPAAIEKCRQSVQFYVNDFRKVSPAIAFERMISNRLTEDSSRWVTTINYPVFQ